MSELTAFMIDLVRDMSNATLTMNEVDSMEWFAGAIAALYGGSPGSDTPRRFNQGYHWAQRYLEENPPPNRNAPSE